MKAAKMVVAAIGATATALLGVLGPDTTVGHVLTVVAAVATTLGVYLVPNAPASAYAVGRPGRNV